MSPHSQFGASFSGKDAGCNFALFAGELLSGYIQIVPKSFKKLEFWVVVGWSMIAGHGGQGYCFPSKPQSRRTNVFGKGFMAARVSFGDQLNLVSRFYVPDPLPRIRAPSHCFSFDAKRSASLRRCRGWVPPWHVWRCEDAETVAIWEKKGPSCCCIPVIPIVLTPSKSAMLRLVSALLLPAAAAEKWAVIAAGSAGFYNYRHQADACHAYQIMLKSGVPAENIILMMQETMGCG